MRRASKPQLPAALLADVREQAARADREITDGYERQAVITAAAYLLERRRPRRRVRRAAEGQPRQEPFAVLPDVASSPSNAKKRGDKAEALRWYREAYEKSEGPATRLQWGASYVAALVELAPRDEAAIEAATAQLWREAAAQPDAFYERSARSLQRVGEKLLGVEQGRRAPRRDGAARGQARRPVRDAWRAAPTSSADLSRAARQARQADAL